MIDESLTMTEEAVTTAPDPDATAAPVVEIPVEQDNQPGDEAPKTFTQEEVDAIVAKAKAKEERKWRREQARELPAELPADDPENEEQPQPLDRKAIIEQHEALKQQQALDEQYEEREEAALEKYDDFDQVAKNPALPVTPTMALAIKASEIGPDILYHLGSEPKEAKRIAQLPGVIQAKEIGKIEAVLTATPPTRKTSTAPTPINPVTGHSRGGPAYDTTDPRSTKTMSTSEWIEADRQRRWKELQARR